MGDPAAPTVLVLAGSLRKPSYTHGLARGVADACERYGFRSVIWDLRERPLPIPDPYDHGTGAPPDNEAAASFRQVAIESSAFVWASPIYHNSYSGLLKLAIDHMEIQTVGGGVVALASHGGGRSTQAVDQLRIVARGLRLWSVPTNVCTDRSDFASPSDYPDPTLGSAAIVARVDRMAAELTSIARLLPAIERAIR